MSTKRVVIMGAAGRDFHNFNTFFRDNDNYQVVAFTATQIPNIEGRHYPKELAGDNYPDGIPIYSEEELPSLIEREGIDQVVFAYSDVSYVEVMRKAAVVLSKGADFWLMGPDSTMIRSSVPVIAVTAVRTGVGKSQTTRKITKILKERGKKVVVIRHPMPYGDLLKQRVQRFETLEDLDKHETTIEEREEYEPHIVEGFVVYAGVDYGAILEEAEKEADIILWDGGNNDLPFYYPDLLITLADPHRPGHETLFYPGEANVRTADVVVLNKVDTAAPEDVDKVEQSVKSINPKARIIRAASPLTLENPESVKGKRVLVVEDGPTLTHGGMTYGAGVIAARQHGAAELVDPRPYAMGSIRETLEKYPGLEPLIPAMGYGKEQMTELEKTIEATPCDVVIIGTPIDLRRVIKIDKDAVRVRYEIEEMTKPDLEDVIFDRFRGILF
ncbi:MAG: cyclic 2,3-diphosphoglycerate synthase [Bacillota bacterium]|jgi:predicted GTPase|nr:cyclic 2,3-diphosphoglycerate synthase [Bacillota bacterium]NLD12243.1 GTPase [Bacillota bacterium]HOB88000.1 cyclic 2,3-diphosphoglycerate synthase [Bacillota bacterium]HOJ57011.1 cyclic 2,3-diphosphoglycerate synthase [Bacillota bacterium]HOL01685.1 cyclic 2,3-diphosphoglycerate synthase [Bacillota bacterium]